MRRLNQVLATAPIALSALALAVVAAVLVTGWERNLKDEGAAAHIFQILIAVQLPIILAYLATANWNRWRGVIVRLGLQAIAMAAALSPVAYFKL